MSEFKSEARLLPGAPVVALPSYDMFPPLATTPAGEVAPSPPATPLPTSEGEQGLRPFPVATTKATHQPAARPSGTPGRSWPASRWPR